MTLIAGVIGQVRMTSCGFLRYKKGDIVKKMLLSLLILTGAQLFAAELEDQYGQPGGGILPGVDEIIKSATRAIERSLDVDPGSGGRLFNQSAEYLLSLRDDISKLHDTLSKLEAKVDERTGWRNSVRSNPIPAAVGLGALGIGAYLYGRPLMGYASSGAKSLWDAARGMGSQMGSYITRPLN